MMKTTKPARTTAPKSQAAIKWVQGVASGRSKRAVSAGADDTEADPLSLIGSVICGEVCIRSFFLGYARLCGIGTVNGGRDTRKPRGEHEVVPFL
jgi:hypothetical protein